jgi:hypothetical protein
MAPGSGSRRLNGKQDLLSSALRSGATFLRVAEGSARERSEVDALSGFLTEMQNVQCVAPS